MTKDYRIVKIRLDDDTLEALESLVKTGPQGYGLTRNDYIREALQGYLESEAE